MKRKRKIKNLLNPTPAQIKYRNRLWADALMKNKRKANGWMCDSKGGRCCLKVAEDVAIACGVKVDRFDSYTPHDNVSDFFGWKENNPHLELPNGETEEAAGINDGVMSKHTTNKNILKHGVTHKKIAECVMNTFVHPSKKKWTFKL